MVGCTIALSGGNAGIGVLKCGGCPDPPEEAQLIPNLFFRARGSAKSSVSRQGAAISQSSSLILLLHLLSCTAGRSLRCPS